MSQRKRILKSKGKKLYRLIHKEKEKVTYHGNVYLKDTNVIYQKKKQSFDKTIMINLKNPNT